MSLPIGRDPAVRRLTVLLIALLVPVAFVLAAFVPVASAAVQAPTGATQTEDAAIAADTTSPTLRGRVVLDGVGVPDSPVTLHRVTPEASGEIASTTTDANGEFRFSVPSVSGAQFTVYFATVDYLSVRFFGDPLHADSAANTEYVIAVHDTASVLPEPLRIASRDMFMLGDLLGGWEVLEVVQVLNPTTLALVSTQGAPSFEFRIPEGASDFEVGEGDVLPHELTWMDGRVLQVTPVTPGSHLIFISYRLPEGPANSTLVLDQPTDTINVFVRQPSHLTAVTGLETTRLIQFQGEEFLLYGARDLQPGATIRFEWGRLEGGAPVNPIVAAVVVTLTLLAVGAFAALRNRGQPT